jgi:hypothetical protein
MYFNLLSADKGLICLNDTLITALHHAFLFGTSCSMLTYVDEHSDNCTVESDKELEEAVRIFQSKDGANSNLCFEVASPRGEEDVEMRADGVPKAIPQPLW